MPDSDIGSADPRGWAARLVGIGLAFGLLATVILGRLAGDALFGIIHAEPAIIAAVTVLLAAVAIAAAAIPARRATRVNPLHALREE